MYIIIAGGGVLAFYTAQLLSKKGNDLVIIEKDKGRSEELTDKLDATVICGDATEIKTLQGAGVEQADIILAMTGGDDTNILICILAEQLGAKRSFCRITHIEYSESLFKKLGIDTVVYPELSIATEIEQMVRDPDLSGFAMLDEGEIEVIELKIKPDSRLIGERVGRLKIPKSSQVVSIIRKTGERELAYPETLLQPDDRVLVLTNKEEIDATEKAFLK